MKTTAQTIQAHQLPRVQRQRLAVALFYRELLGQGVQRSWLHPIAAENPAQVRTHPSTDIIQFMSAPPHSNVGATDPKVRVIGSMYIDFFGDADQTEVTLIIDTVMDFIRPTSRKLYREAMQAGDAPKTINTTIVDFEREECEAIDSPPFIPKTRPAMQRPRRRYGNAAALAGGKVKMTGQGRR